MVTRAECCAAAEMLSGDHARNLLPSAKYEDIDSTGGRPGAAESGGLGDLVGLETARADVGA